MPVLDMGNKFTYRKEKVVFDCLKVLEDLKTINALCLEEFLKFFYQM